MRIRVLLALALIALFAAGCGAVPYATSTPEGYVAPEPTAAPTVAPTAGQAGVETGATAAAPGGVEVALATIQPVGGVLATVNGAEITWKEYEPELLYALHSITQQYGVDWNQAENIQMVPSVQDQVLQSLISRYLLRQVAAEEGITVSDAELQALLEEQKTSILSSGYADWEQFKTEAGVSDEYFAQLLSDDALFERLGTAHAPAREAEQVHARHILIEDQATAEQVLARVNAGEDFAALAQEFSIDTGSSAAGGDLGWFPKGMMVAEFETAAFSLEVGQTSALVQTDYGYHIIQVLEKGVRELDDDTYSTMASQAGSEWLTEKQKTSTIEVLVTFAQ